MSQITIQNRSGHELTLVPPSTTETVERFIKKTGQKKLEKRPVGYATLTIRNGETRTLSGPYARMGRALVANNAKILDVSESNGVLTPAQKGAETKARNAAREAVKNASSES